MFIKPINHTRKCKYSKHTFKESGCLWGEEEGAHGELYQGASWELSVF